MNLVVIFVAWPALGTKLTNSGLVRFVSNQDSGALRNRQSRLIGECPGSGIILIKTNTAAARRRVVAIEVAVAAGPFYEVKHAIGHCNCIAVEFLIDVDRGKPGTTAGVAAVRAVARMGSVRW